MRSGLPVRGLGYGPRNVEEMEMSLNWMDSDDDGGNGTWTGLAWEIFGVICILVTFWLLALIISVFQQ